MILDQFSSYLQNYEGENGLTNHSLCPWKPSWLSLFTAITSPVPGLAAVNECSSIHPLKTEPKPPSPKTLSGRKFLVAVLRSEKLKLFRLEDCKIWPSVRRASGTETDETSLLELWSFPSVLTYLELSPAQANVQWGFNNLSNYFNLYFYTRESLRMFLHTIT